MPKTFRKNQTCFTKPNPAFPVCHPNSCHPNQTTFMQLTIWDVNEKSIAIGFHASLLAGKINKVPITYQKT